MENQKPCMHTGFVNYTATGSVCFNCGKVLSATPGANVRQGDIYGQTHTAKMLRAARHIAADIGTTPEIGATIIGAALDKLTLEEKWELAR